MAMDNKERCRRARDQKREKGLVLKQLWIHPSRIEEYEKLKENMKTAGPCKHK